MPPRSVTFADRIDTLTPEQIRHALHSLITGVALKSEAIERNELGSTFNRATLCKLSHATPVLERLKFAAQSEAYNAEQKSMVEETVLAGLAALAMEIEPRALAWEKPDMQTPKRAVLPPDLPRSENRHQPDCTTGVPAQS